MGELRIRCTVTRYLVIFPEDEPNGVLRQHVREETTSARVEHGQSVKIIDGWPRVLNRPPAYLYLDNSEASAPLADLLAAAREGRGWDAQAGTPPVYVEGAGWGGRNYPRIRVEADALLELARALETIV